MTRLPTPAAQDDPTAERSRTAEEQQLAARTAAFRKELGLRDLVLTQVLFVVGLGWVGTAARLGPSHLVFWLLAIALFYLPSAVVVMYLIRLMPLEGGLYQWSNVVVILRGKMTATWRIEPMAA